MTRSKEKLGELYDLGAEPALCDVFDAGRLGSEVARAEPEAVINKLTDLPLSLNPRKLAEYYARSGCRSTPRCSGRSGRERVRAFLARAVHRVQIGDLAEIEIEDFVPPQSPEGEAYKLTDIYYPPNSTLTIARATTSRFNAFGLEFSHEGKNGLSAPFTWAA